MLTLRQAMAGTEGISISNDSKLGIMLEAEFKQLRRNGVKVDQTLKVASDIIYKLSGISVNLRTVAGANAYVHCPGIDRNHIFNYDNAYYDQMAADGRKLLSKEKVVRGAVDTNNVKVTGAFTDIVFIIRIGTTFFDPAENFTAEEATAILLHEIGHVFGYLELLYRTSTTNYILDEIVNRMRGTFNENVAYELLKESKKKGYTLPEEEILKSKNIEMTKVLIIKQGVEEAKSDLGYNIYDIRGNEALADQFATRLGYGRPLATALAKMHSPMGTFSTTARILLSFARLAAELYAFFGVTIVLDIIYGPDTTYDDNMTRPEVIRQQLSRMLKAGDMDKESKKDIIEDIDAIEAAWEKAGELFILGFLLWRFTPWGSRRSKLMKMQKELEKLANNRFAEIAARIEVS